MAKKQPRKTSAQGLVLSGKPTTPAPSVDRLLGDLRSLIEQARQQVARTVSTGMVALYWHIGKRIREDILHEQRAEYGEQIVATLSAQLTAEYGKGFNRFSLSRMVKLAEYFPDANCCHTVATIELEPFPRDSSAGRSPETRLLRRDVSHRAVECPHVAAEDRPVPVRADGRQQEARGVDSPGPRHPARRGPPDARPSFPRPVFPRLPGTYRVLQREGRGAGHLAGTGSIHSGTGH